MQTNPLVKVYTDFCNIIKNSEVFMSEQAEKYETLDMRKKADEYITAVRNEDNFNTYYKYDMDIICDVIGCSEDSNEAYNYYIDKSLIPQEYRDKIFTYKHQRVILQYEEPNNYYRYLIGMPDIGDIDFFYVTDEISNDYNIPKDVPIHLLSDSDKLTIESIGYVNKLYEQNPSKKYLKKIGAKKIDLVLARTSRDFSLLHIPQDLNETMRDNFVLIYEQCREYFMSCIYIKEYRVIYDYYDNFIGLAIMVMAMQQIMARTVKVTIEREFFDSYCVQLLYETYGIPYNELLDEPTQKIIMQNLNILIQNKGTNKVLFDIMGLLGYDRIKIYKYYLMKAQNFNSEGFPVEATKTIHNEDGTEEVVPDYQAMYDVYFQKVLINDDDIYVGLMDNKNRVPYNEVIHNDPYWWEDSELEKELYESEYNFVESKYMGVAISYKMTQIIFDNIYFMKMLQDNKYKISNVTIEIPKILSYSTCKLFDVVIALCAMICKQNHLKGEILYSPSKIMHVLGFNFQADFDTIRSDLYQNEYIDNSLTDYLVTMNYMNKDDINNLYNNIKELHSYINEKLSNTNDINAYRAYMKIYKTLFITKENPDIFSTGEENAETYIDYLKYINPDLYNFVENTDEGTMYHYIEHILTKIQAFVPEIRYLGLSIEDAATVEKTMMEMIRFFKSYTTDFLDMTVVYVLDLKPESMMKLIDEVRIHSNILVEEKYPFSFDDNIKFTSTLSKKDYLKMVERYEFKTIISLFDRNFNFFKLRDELKLKNIYMIDEKTYLDDYISYLYSLLELREISIKINDKLYKQKNHMNEKDDIKVYDRISEITNKYLIDEYNKLNDKIKHIQKDINIKDEKYFKDDLSLKDNIEFNDGKILLSDKVEFNNFMYEDEKSISLLDTLSKMSIQEDYQTSLSLTDKCFYRFV